MPLLATLMIDAHCFACCRDGVYDITEFIAMHPGGTNKIMLAGETVFLESSPGGGGGQASWLLCQVNSPFPSPEVIHTHTYIHIHIHINSLPPCSGRLAGAVLVHLPAAQQAGGA